MLQYKSLGAIWGLNKRWGKEEQMFTLRDPEWGHKVLRSVSVLSPHPDFKLFIEYDEVDWIIMY